MAVGSGQTVAETQERGPEELHIAGPVQAGRGRGARQAPGSRWLSPRRSRHSAQQISQSAQGSQIWLQRLRTPPFGPAPPDTPPRPPPRPARCCPGAWGLGRWRRGAPARGAERATPPGQIRHELRVRSLVGLWAALWACSGWWVCVPRQSRVRERGTSGSAHTRGRDPALAGCKVVDRSRTIPERPLPAPCVPTLSPPPPSPGLRSAAPPQIRGCLFLLGLSMLSLFGRLCHRLDAGNKV